MYSFIYVFIYLCIHLFMYSFIHVFIETCYVQPCALYHRIMNIGCDALSPVATTLGCRGRAV